MRRFALTVICLLSLQVVLVSEVKAETQYVTDSLDVALRTGESNRYRIIRMLPSGTALEVLSATETTDYVRVRTEDGTVGYVLERELQAEPAARTRIAALEGRLAELQAEPDAMAAKLAALQAEHARIDADLQVAQRENQRLTQELATIRHASANILEITGDRDRLRIQVGELTRERADLEQANRDLSHQNTQRWFMIGAGVILVGILIGIVLPRLSFRRRRSSWESL